MFPSGNGFKKDGPWKYFKKRKIKEYIIDETAIKSGLELVWIWVVIEPANKEILSFGISKERNMFISERILSEAVNMYGKHQVSSDGIVNSYPLACRFLKINHHIHSSFEKSLIERKVQYIKDRIESSDDYFPCKKKQNIN